MQTAEQGVDLVGRILRQAGASERQSRPPRRRRRAPGAPPPKDDEGARWVEYAATCYLQAAKHGPQRFRHELVNVLHLLAFSEHTNAVGRAMAKHVDAIQRWVWIPYIPQLLLSLLNREAPHAKALLLRLAQAHPQAIYCSLRTFLLERREAATRITQTARQLAAKAQESAGAAQKVVEGAGGAEGEEAQRALAQAKTDKIAAQAAAQAAGEATVAFDSAKEVMERLRHKHSHLVTELEVLLSELGARFASSPEERLLVVVYTLLHRCYKYPTATTAEVPASFKKELTGVCRACFSADTSTKHADFVAEYKAQYERDLDPEQPTFPSQLSELIDRLKRWKTQLQADVEDRLPTTLRLEDESPALRGMRFAEVEVPGQYNGDAAEGAPDRPTKLERVGAEVRVVRRHGTSHRCLTFLGVDGGERRFLVQTSLTPAARGEERMLQLLRSLNASLAHHTETRRRGLSYYTPSVVPVWPQVRLVEDDAAHGTYGEVYEINCARYGREADLPISIFKTALNDAVTGKVQGAEAVLDLRLKAFADITQNHVTENIFSQYMYKTLPTGSHLWTFKRQLCQQLALSSFISALLRIGGRTPQKIMFAKNTGRIFMLDFHPAFDSKGMTEFVEPVPFRLTRNLHTFFFAIRRQGRFRRGDGGGGAGVRRAGNQHRDAADALLPRSAHGVAVETHDIRRESPRAGHRPHAGGCPRHGARQRGRGAETAPVHRAHAAASAARRCRRRTAPCRRACCTWWRRPSTPRISAAWNPRGRRGCESSKATREDERRVPADRRTRRGRG